MKIRDKLFLGFGLYIFLASILGFLTYKELQTITTKLSLVETADDITNTFLEVRRYEKNFMLYRDKDSLHELKQYLGVLKRNIDNIKTEIIKEIGINNYDMMKKTITEYERLFDRMVEGEKDVIDRMRLKAREIQSFTESLSKKERANIDAVSKRSIRLLLYALLTIIVLGTIINIKLGMSIARPIKSLEEITKKVAGGDFSERIEIKGRDEIASLGASFNQMEERLQDTMKSLELAIKRLHEKQEQLVEAEKLASLGRIAAGVAHEINNPLAIVNEKAGLMQDILQMSGDFQNKEKFSNLIDGIIGSVNRCRAITHRLLGFARKMDVTIGPMDLNESIKDVKGFLEKEILLKSIRIEMNLMDGLPKINSDKGQIEQVFLNIMKNAIDAVEEGGLIVVSTGIKDENTVQVSIRDNGPGMPKDKLKHIFEPFFTTKGREKGTGLGLFVSYGIMKKLGGGILVESEVDKGTTFIIEIPVNLLT
ncbi:MAG: HAMP domain-containing protein [Nitrospirae bacterium]|nr:HAMP domain-containing protein [Nitrospirota bacterium]